MNNGKLFHGKILCYENKIIVRGISLVCSIYVASPEVNDRYIEVMGTSEIEIVPDKIHYLIEIRSILKRSSTVSPSQKNIVQKYL